LLLATLLPALSDARDDKTTGLPLCPKPADRCDSPVKRFAPYELPLRLPSRLAPNVDYSSVPFYAVVLRRDRDPACDGGEFTKATEDFRKQAQTRFPDRKVFADHQCPDMGAVSYTMDGQPSTISFVAIYGGKTEAEARQILAKARTRYPGVQMHRMRVVFERIVQ